VDEQFRIRSYTGPTICLLLVLICAGFAGNLWTPRLYSGLTYLWGGIPVLLTVRLFGTGWGLVAGLVAATATISAAGHPYALLWLLPEPLFVGWMLSQGKTRNIILYDAIYWPLVGAPLFWICFRYALHTPAPDTLAALLLCWISGITNALVASLLLAYAPRLAALAKQGQVRSITIHQLIFNLLMAVVVLPAFAIMIIYGKNAVHRNYPDLIEEHSRAQMIVLCLDMLALAISLYTSRRLSAPLVWLSQITSDLPERLLKGKIAPWPESRVTEIDRLSHNFRVMATALGYKFQEITYYSETMETRVRERTNELTRANRELQREIVERQLTEKQRDRLLVELVQKNKELEGIVYVASHDLRSPLVNVQGFSRKLAKSCAELEGLVTALAADGGEVERQRLEMILHENIPRSLGFITGSVEKIDGLLKGLLRLSRLGRASLCFETLDMQTIIEKIVSSMAYQIDTLGVTVAVGKLGPCLADAGQVTQVFSNLLDNAIKYRSTERPLEVRVFSEEFENGIRYGVEDNGIGIAAECRDRIWEIFHRLNPDESPGEGLGLTLARQIVARLGGSIWVESTPGAGSCFYVVLPKPAAVE
jgi:signal transduction histidine kinase